MSSLICFLFLLPNAQVDVATNDGAKHQGKLLSVSAEVVAIERDGKRVEFARDALARVVFNQGKTSGARGRDLRGIVHLTDGSKLSIKHYTVSKGIAELVLPDGNSARVATGSIDHVKFGEQTSANMEQWLPILAEPKSSDAIVTDRNGELDFLEGALGNISATHFQFRLDGDDHNVRSEKVQGIIYFHAEASAYPAAPCKVKCTNGIEIHAEELMQKENRIVATTANGIELPIATTSVLSIHYTAGNSVYLSDIEPEQIEWKPAIGSDRLRDDIERFFQPHRDQNFLGKQLGLVVDVEEYRIEEFQKGLCIHSQTELTYRLAREYRRFRALAGIDRSMVPNGTVKLTIKSDDNVLFEREITGRSNAIPIDLDVSRARRLRISVGFADDSDNADHLTLANARLAK